MRHYLLSTQQPDGQPPASVDMDRVVREVAALERDMRAAGVRVFNDHLMPPDQASVVRVDGDDVRTAGGPYADGGEHVGGVAVIRVPDDRAALDWGRRMAQATMLPVEVRQFQRDAQD